MELTRRSTFAQALREFHSKIAALTRDAVDGRQYMQVEGLKDWMRAPNPTNPLDGRYVTNTNLLAHAAYFCRSNFLPLEPSTIADSGRRCCVVVFSILLDLDLGHLVHIFAQTGVHDDKLPVPLSSLKEKLHDVKEIPNGDEIAQQFDQRQWAFCPAFFTMDMDEQFFEHRIVPVCRRSHINSGGTAQVWQIVVQAEFVDQKLRRLLDDDEFASYEDQKFGSCYLFALKTFEEGNFEHYENEKIAFHALRTVPGVIRRLGCFSHRPPVSAAATVTATATSDEQDSCPEEQNGPSRNLLLEYGTYDLRLIFGHEAPPVFPIETIAFWEALFGVASAVHGIHKFKHGGNEFNGWHADIKPENIIYVRGKYKLADPGYACFKKAQETPKTSLRGGTDTYGAPEASKGDAHQTIDTWSLGCVFSMAATWIVMGYQGVRQYHLVRQKALSNMLKKIGGGAHPLLASQRLSDDAKPGKLDCFHDGTHVLNEVTSWHALLKGSCRRTDPITAAVIQLIDDEMLLRNPTKRSNSEALCESLRRIIDGAKKTLRERTVDDTTDDEDGRERLEDLLKQIEKEDATQHNEQTASVVTQPFPRGLPVNREALKVQMDHLPLKKTSHRFETIPEPRSRPYGSNMIVDLPIISTSDPSGNTIPAFSLLSQTESNEKRKSGRSSALSRLAYTSTFGQPSRSDTGTSNPSRRTTGTEPKNWVAQNVIQARESIDRERSRGALLPKKRPQKDGFLSTHFINRDIKFLVDNAESMSEHWDAATFLLETLVLKSHGQDPDGPDLSFTKHSAKLSRQPNATEFRKLMSDVRPEPKSGVHTDIKTALEPILYDYISGVEDAYRYQKVRALTVIVLTDGLWEGMTDCDDIIHTIVQFYTQLKKAMRDRVRTRQVSIQFIQFGDDEEARERLQRLDDDTPYRGVPDIIDYEKFTIRGDINKMLLGSFVAEMDAINNDSNGTSSPTDSPPPQSPGSPVSTSAVLDSITAALGGERRGTGG